MHENALNQLLDRLEELEEFGSQIIWSYGKTLQFRAFLRNLVLFRGSFRPIRLLTIYGFTLPLSILIYQPVPHESNPPILTMWVVSVAAALSLYKLSPI